MSKARILIAGLRGGCGKTLASLGLSAAWYKRGRRVAPFKKGPDYIDAAWLSRAAGRPCRNLDLFLMSPQVIERSFAAGTGQAEVAVIEGNRGLFDGLDAEGTYSTAELAKLLRCPVVLVVDCTKSTRTVAAMVLGCQRLDAQVLIRGVILNQTAGARHETVLRQAIQQDCGLPVLGAIVRTDGPLLPERHLGLVPPQEHEHVTGVIQQMADMAERHLDLQAIWALAREAPTLEPPAPDAAPPDVSKPETVRVGVFRDAAFQFYYPENLEALARGGAILTEISPLRDPLLPDVDALYIGGGFPETLAPSLTKNASFLGSLRRSIQDGLPVYAECGGAVYLGEELRIDDHCHAMAGVLPVAFTFQQRPCGHGYTMLETVAENPFFSVGDTLRGHEFHYTCMQSSAASDLAFAFRVRRGYGFDGQRDGLCRYNVLASYTHLHALGTEGWAPGIIQAAIRHQSRVGLRRHGHAPSGGCAGCRE